MAKEERASQKSDQEANVQRDRASAAASDEAASTNPDLKSAVQPAAGTVSGAAVTEERSESLNPCSCQSGAAPSTFDCNPCSDPVATANRVIRDPRVSAAVSVLLGAAAQSVKDSPSESIKTSGLSKGGQKSIHGALEGIAKAFAGKDAVPAKGECCGGQLRLFFEIQDPVTGKRTPLDAELARHIVPRLIDESFNLAAITSTFEGDSHVFRAVEPKPVRISLAAEIVQGGEISELYEVKYPGDTEFRHYQRQSTSGMGFATTNVTLTFESSGGSTNNLPSFTFTAVLSTAPGFVAPSGTITFNSYYDEGTTPTPLTAAPVVIKGGQATCTIDNSAFASGIYAITATYSGDENYAPATSNPVAGGSPQKGEAGGGKHADAAGLPTPIVTNGPQPIPTQGFLASVFSGMETVVKLILLPPAAHVRCFSWLDGEGAGCLLGNQYISKVAISAWHGDTLVRCSQTGDSGCSGFKLNPGWYNFSAPEDITIEGCNYSLSSNSPVSAFLGAGQCCSDLYFRYKKKGNEIEVISEILYSDVSNPYVEAKSNFAGMQYLLLREGDPTFAQQQTTADGAAFRFRNLPSGTYLLFCQAPAAFGSHPVHPVYPPGGRLALTVFAGQTSAVPVPVKFRTGINAPAVLDGFVRDDTGQPIPGQLVRIVNNAGCVAAAGVTDATGYYSIQIYSADNLTIEVGAQQVPVSKAQIQAAMQTVGTPALPSPGATMEVAMQGSDMVNGF